MIDDKVKDRIMKLLRKADPDANNNEHEIEACMARVHELLRQHNLTLMEAAGWEQEVKDDVTHKWTKMGAQKFANFSWCVQVMNGVCKMTNTAVMQDPPNRTYCFIGSELDVDVAIEIYSYVVEQMKLLVKGALRNEELRADSPNGRKYFNDYMLACGIKVKHRMIALAENDAQTTALVRLTDARNQQYSSEVLHSRPSRGHAKTKVDQKSRATHLGYQQGDHISLRKGTDLENETGFAIVEAGEKVG